MAGYLIGLDAGTTSFKAGLYDSQLRQLAHAAQDYTLQESPAGYVEFPPQRYYEILCALVRRLLADAQVAPAAVAGLAISCQGETLLCLDEYGQPLMDAIVWLDNRSVAQADLLRSAFGKQTIYEKTGQADMLATWPATKVLWLQQNRPDFFAKTAKFLLLEDYLIYRLTGALAGEYNLYASSAYFDLHHNNWWPQMLQRIGIDAGRLPSLLPSAAKVAPLCAAAQADTGLGAAMVCTGALDQTCSAIGAGIAGPGIVAETTGSCLAVSANTDHFIPYCAGKPITCQNHAVPSRYIILLWSQTAGMAFKWFANSFYNAQAIGLEQAFAQMNRDAATVAPGSEGLLMLPHLSGASNPEFDPNAKGVFYGVTLKHTRAHFTRAVMESVAFMLRRNLEQVARQQPIGAVYAMGGGAKSPLWLQIKADVTQTMFLPVPAAESACRGAALLAGVGIGMLPDIDTAAAPLLQTSQVFTPDPSNRPVYDRQYAAYIALYEALKPLWTPR